VKIVAFFSMLVLAPSEKYQGFDTSIFQDFYVGRDNNYKKDIEK
jgi:hypothetical protein